MFFWLIKFILKVQLDDLDSVGIILTTTSILFGFLSGFFISELWSRYSEIRTLQSVRSSSGINMIRYAEYFFKNEKFKKDFIQRTESASIADEIIEWDEGHKEISYFRDIEKSFRLLSNEEIATKKDDTYFNNMIDSYHVYVEMTVRLDTLGKERLFSSEWFMLILLSLLIVVSVIFIDISDALYQLVVLIFPAIISLAMLIIYDLDSLNWSKDTVSLEPNARIFDALGVQRFYLNKKKKFLKEDVGEYRTEDDLDGEHREIFKKISGLQ